jgi:hypothetical protein
MRREFGEHLGLRRCCFLSYKLQDGERACSEIVSLQNGTGTAIRQGTISYSLTTMQRIAKRGRKGSHDAMQRNEGTANLFGL